MFCLHDAFPLLSGLGLGCWTINIRVNSEHTNTLAEAPQIKRHFRFLSNRSELISIFGWSKDNDTKRSKDKTTNNFRFQTKFYRDDAIFSTISS